MKNDQNTYIQELKDLLRNFRDERDWAKFHKPKDLAEAMAIEVGELMELFLWKDDATIREKIQNDPAFKERVEEELADVINYCLNMSNTLNLDISQIVNSKMVKAGVKYPVEKAKGTAKKYNEL